MMQVFHEEDVLDSLDLFFMDYPRHSIWARAIRWIKRLPWKLYLFTNPYNRLKLNLPERGYYDPDTRILYACFSIFKEYFEGDCKNIEHDPETYGIIEELYKYWTEEWKEHFEASTMLEENRLYEKENEMLIKLISIRSHLWY